MKTVLFVTVAVAGLWVTAGAVRALLSRAQARLSGLLSRDVEE